MARVSITKHQHKPNQQKSTTQIKQQKINGMERIERSTEGTNNRKERQKGTTENKIEWNE